MTEYTENCDVYPSDSVKAYTSGRGVWIDAESGENETAIKLGATKARDFARGILALADEIDGGEAKPAEPRTVKVGDRLRVTEDGLYDAEVFVGDVLAVKYVYDNGGTFYTEGDEWVFNARHIGNGLDFVDETPAATTPAEEPALKVGDRVVVVKDCDGRASERDGAAGVIADLDLGDSRYPYMVNLDSHGEGWWVHSVRREDEKAPAPASSSVADPRRLAALKEAQAMIDAGQSDADEITLARFLLGE